MNELPPEQKALIKRWWQYAMAFPQLRELTNWAIEARYPVHGDDPTEDEARFTAHLAQGIWQAVHQDLIKRLGDL
ncbi:MAG: hypothetical protein ACHWZW_02085 [Spirulina sp.]